MYKNKIVCAIKHNNAPLSENKDTVFIPFNTEYSIFLKNMNDTVAYISIFIDGKDINPNKKIKLYPKCTATIEKFPLTNHKFIFKERTRALQEVRENQDEDGLIRLEVSFQVKSYINENSILDKIKKIKPTNPYQKGSPFKPQPFNPIPGIYKERHFEDDPFYKKLSNLKANGENGSIPLQINSKKQDSTRFDAQSSIVSSEEKKNYREKEKNTGFTAPGKIKEKSDDIIFYEQLSSMYKVNEEFSFVIRLEKSDKLLENREVKKICPTCKKKYKNKYFYCPFDGTFLDYK